MLDPSLGTAQLNDWLARMRAGDPAAREDLLRGACGRMERLTRKMLRGFPNVRRWADTDDVMQGALLRLVRSLEQLQPAPASTREFFALAAEQIRRELLDLARRYGSAKRRGGSQEVRLAHADDSSAVVAEPVDDRRDGPDELERWTAFHEAVGQLPSAEREVVGLIFYHGWSQGQIAELFQVSDRTVRRYWQAACIRIKDALGDHLPEP
jgi:RNA polymerase sigma-70 factor (ECF subfamily)